MSVTVILLALHLGARTSSVAPLHCTPQVCGNYRTSWVNEAQNRAAAQIISDLLSKRVVALLDENAKLQEAALAPPHEAELPAPEEVTPWWAEPVILIPVGIGLVVGGIVIGVVATKSATGGAP